MDAAVVLRAGRLALHAVAIGADRRDAVCAADLDTAVVPVRAGRGRHGRGGGPARRPSWRRSPVDMDATVVPCARAELTPIAGSTWTRRWSRVPRALAELALHAIAIGADRRDAVALERRIPRPSA